MAEFAQRMYVAFVIGLSFLVALFWVGVLTTCAIISASPDARRVALNSHELLYIFVLGTLTTALLLALLDSGR